jgi:hypothetical protein
MRRVTAFVRLTGQPLFLFQIETQQSVTLINHEVS